MRLAADCCALGASVGLAAVAWRKLVEQETGALRGVRGLAAHFGWILQPGGVLDREAIQVERVGGGLLGGEIEFVVLGLLLPFVLASEEAKGGFECGGVTGDPAFCLQGGGVFFDAGENDAGALEFRGKGLRVVDTDLEFFAQSGGVAGKCELCGAPDAGGEALDFVERGLLLVGEVGDLRDLPNLLVLGLGNRGNLFRKGGGKSLTEALCHGRGVGGIIEGGFQSLGGVDQHAEGAVEFGFHGLDLGC